MKILLTGSKGQLGQEIMNNIPKGIELIPLSRDNLDLKNYKECREIIKKLNPDWIINSGAYTKVDDAEDNRDIALAINGLAPKAFAEELSKTGGKILQISTDYVFKGDQAFPYSVNNIRNPINQYGYTKAIGEEFIEGILGENKQGVILRTSWLMSAVGENFVKTILKLLSQKDKINIVSDQIGSFTSTKTLSKACWEIINLYSQKNNNIDLPNILHWTDKGQTTWYEIAKKIKHYVREKGISNMSAKILPVTTSKFITKAKRPPYSVLNCRNTYKILGIEPTCWEESLKYILDKLI